MTLRETRCTFTSCLAALIRHMEASGYEVAIDWVRRTPACGIGTLGNRSTHANALAADLNLYRNGKYLSATAAHEQFGVWWEQLHPLARWGGRFNDGNHYSFEWQGVK